ncbi:MAG TPA: serine/threonine-protein kinase [Polyangiaceae bacterium]|nr:serine/threonine-protein kinase [Polyangiaceae bacterium]
MSAPWPEELPQGFEFEQFTVLDCIWRGSASSIYRAESAATGIVALKVFDRAKSEAKADKRSAQRRSKSARQTTVRHPNLAVVVAAGEWRERAFVATEWLDGCDLEDYLDRWGAMSDDEVAELGLHLISGLMALHHAGALHGDVKPSSIFLSNGVDGDVIPKLLLSDLPNFSGLASPVDSTTRQVAVSTPAYLSPEAIRGRGVGAAADQYSVCAVLYECSVGHAPFEGESLLDLLRSMALGNIQAPRSLRPDLSEALEAAILRGLQTDPAARFESLRDLGRALWPLVSERAREPWARSFGDAAGAVESGAGRSPRLAAKKPSTLFVLAASIALSIGLGAVYFYSVRSGANNPPPPRDTDSSQSTSGLRVQY